ncbi:MAG: DUF4230 domain-containing protein [Lachnospiraceae bacterium]|nr:DUF4230 domain-containing protein [Lachnospiraceae bacterium]
MRDREDRNDNNFKLYIVFTVVVLVIGVIIGIVCTRAVHNRKVQESVKEAVIGHEGEVTTTIYARLENVVKSAKLYTAEYPYNGYVAVRDEEGNIKYYVSYEGTVKAGIEDVSKITCSIDKEKKEITVRLPEITIYPPVVNAGTMEYIFAKDKYNKENVAQEAYAKAIEDLTNKLYADKDFMESAVFTAKSTERAIIDAWISQLEDADSYKVNILAFGEEAKDEN